MKIRIETKYGKAELEDINDDMNIHEMMDLYERLLLSITFTPDIINEGFIAKAEEIKNEN